MKIIDLVNMASKGETLPDVINICEENIFFAKVSKVLPGVDYGYIRITKNAELPLCLSSDATIFLEDRVDFLNPECLNLEIEPIDFNALLLRRQEQEKQEEEYIND